MWWQWHEQREYMDISWGCGYFLATVFVLVNLVGQLGGVFMVLFRKKVEVACGLLLFIVVLQVSGAKGITKREIGDRSRISTEAEIRVGACNTVILLNQ